MSNGNSNRKPVSRIVLFLVCAVVIFLGLNTLYSFINTLHQLDAIELERDQWQRPSDVLLALDLREGNAVADLGSGSGYFTLKLAPAVGRKGQVLAVDLRRLSLFFLWSRALIRGQHAVHVIVGDEDDPRLATQSVDAVLICNTYHELSHPKLILTRVYQSLRVGAVWSSSIGLLAAPRWNILTRCLSLSSRTSCGRPDSRSSATTIISSIGWG